MTGLKSPFKMRGRGSRIWPAWAVMAVAATLLSLAVGERMRGYLFDAWQRLAPRAIAAENVRVVLIDSDSLAAVGTWPWPRYYLARLAEEIGSQDAKVIGFDVLFPESDPVRPDRFAKLYPELSGAATNEIAALPSMDALFGQAVGRAPIVIARAGADSGITDPDALIVDARISGQLPRDVDRWPAAIIAIPELEDSALGHGLVNGPPDADGIVRAVPMIMRVAGKPMPGLALEMARLSLGAEAIRASPSSVTVQDRRIPIDRRGRMLLRFGDFPNRHIVSAADVLSRHVPRDYFTGKIVLIGLAAEGTADIVATPLTAENYGVVVQAQAIDSILSSRWLDRPGWSGPVEWIVAALMALLALATGLWRRAPRVAFAIAMIALPVAGWLAFDRLSLLLDATRPLLIGGGALAGVVVGLFADARRERERLRDVLVEERIAAAETEGELQAARAIQMSIVPDRATLAAFDPRLDVDALLEPARSVGGDFFDVARLDDNRIAFLVGDVTGKGVPAALFMAMSKALTSSALYREAADVGRVMASVNDELMRSGNDAMSVTILMGMIDLSDGSVALSSAGHEDPYVISGSAISLHRLEGGPPLGITDYAYPVETTTLNPGDMLILVTDGITEAQDAAGALYGRDRIITDLGSVGGDAAQTVAKIRDAVRAFENGTDPTDDLTLMALRYLGS